MQRSTKASYCVLLVIVFSHCDASAGWGCSPQTPLGGGGTSIFGTGGTTALGGTTPSTAANGDASSPCAGGPVGPASGAVGETARVSRYGMVQFNGSLSTHFIELKTTLTVPAAPLGRDTLYVWPGLEPWPGGDNYDPIGQGVLQPVLTWGTSCGTYAPRNPRGWWISPQYVNPFTREPDYYWCRGGTAIDVNVGAELDITMTLNGTVWTQVVVDRQTGQRTTFDMDMAGQAQNWALFQYELATSNRPVADGVFTSTVLTSADPDPAACRPSVRGPNDYISPPQLSPDGTKCCISRIVVRAQGVAATSPNTP